MQSKSYYKELEHIIKSNKLEQQVFLKGTTDVVPIVLRHSDIFAFPSAHEGFSLALGEAMSIGLPTVAFKSCVSVNAMIEDGKQGFLCADGADAFAEGLEKLMRDKEFRIRMGQAAKQDMKKYAPEKIWDTWENLLKIYCISGE